MIHYKPGVRVFGIRPETVLAIQVAHEVYELYNADLVVTSVIEGSHSRGSLHYTGQAVDLRLHDWLTVQQHEEVADEIRKCLTDDYDVVLESNHIHIEYQPKESYT